MLERFARAAEILLHGILDHAFPGAVAEVGRRDGAIWRRSFGALTYEPGAAAMGQAAEKPAEPQQHSGSGRKKHPQVAALLGGLKRA